MEEGSACSLRRTGRRRGGGSQGKRNVSPKSASLEKGQGWGQGSIKGQVGVGSPLFVQAVWAFFWCPPFWTVAWSGRVIFGAKRKSPSKKKPTKRAKIRQSLAKTDFFCQRSRAFWSKNVRKKEKFDLLGGPGPPPPVRTPLWYRAGDTHPPKPCMTSVCRILALGGGPHPPGRGWGRGPGRHSRPTTQRVPGIPVQALGGGVPSSLWEQC